METYNNKTSPTKLIAIAGGIGSGKSVVSHILHAMGYDVYDCDSRAKYLMGENEQIKKRIFKEISENAICFPYGQDWKTAEIDRPALSDIVFNDAAKLDTLDKIVHNAIRNDIKHWYQKNARKSKHLFVETAILYTSGLDTMVDDVWYVTAPEELRISRAMSRDIASRQKVLARINCQKEEETILKSKGGFCSIINNDNNQPILPQIIRLL